MLDYFLCVIGMVMIIEGVPYFAFPDKMKQWITKMTAMSDRELRRFGFAVMIIGLVLIYFGRR